MPLAGGAVLQVDQAAPAHQDILRHFRKRRQIANLDRRLGLIVKKRLALTASLYEILQILSLTLFEKTPVNGLFDSGRSHNILGQRPNQLNLFD